MECTGPNPAECTSCYNSNGFYSKEDDNNIICYSTEEIEEGYYLDSYSKIIKKCNNRCLSCNRGGTNTQSNCIKCINDDYHFDPIKSNHCINETELSSISYYLDTTINKYKRCNTACLTCYGPNNNNCILCNNQNGYYYKEGFGETKVKDFTVYGYKGSEAERYANANGITFVVLERNASADATR